MPDLLQQLQQLLGPGGVLTGTDVSSRIGGWGENSCEAMAVIRPRTTQEVSEAILLCNQHGQSIVTQGGKTSMVRGAFAGENDIALSMERMSEIEELDAVNATMTVQAGVPLQTVQEAANDAGLSYPMDLGARGSATIGGTISTNAGGNRVIRHGMTRALVLGLEVVMADGTIVSSLNKMVKNNAGYDLKQLFIGSEGTLGIVTRAVLKLSPALSTQQTALVCADSFEAVTDLLAYCRKQLAANLCAFEVMWNNYFQMVTAEGPTYKKSPLNRDQPFYVLLESAGTDPQRDPEHFEQVLGQCLENETISDAVIAKSGTEREELWAIRDNIEALHQMVPFHAFDISLVLGKMGAYLERVQTKLQDRWPDMRQVVFGHLGDGNIHLVVTIGSETEEDRHALESVVYSELEACGGSISAEHGIGLEKRDFLHHSRSQAEIDLMRVLKNTLDPKNLLNPGKLLNLTS